ncbi:pyridoxamine 5'-phosphate oxidase family protein [uncultured Parasutterella sp.]|jgi:nitroimidazol reductase NimA-like FMN-containing flavoprotein (pyridoxamine 5'-phosphate oxidase superfamily)|uniref:pyridoxamine 5'-phosphate oxidase family protein n=1 Tax=uncultured Parasutterella sp. TaxID=1263098 RepID=UPI0025E9080C|nr:pyridoxamine 5'-phosphate oxidase family protein [uncultured Parasutterella sp.]
MNRREMFKIAATATLLSAGAVNAAEMKSTERPMRRTDRILTLEEAKEVIRHTPHAVLATADASGQPYGVPISPALVGNELIFHGTAADGRKWENLRQNPKVTVTFVGRGETASDELPGEFSVNYASAIVTGVASKVTDEAEKEKLAKAIAMRQVPQAGKEGIDKYYEAFNKGIQVWKIKITSISGKARNKQGYFNKLKTE